MLFVDDTKLYRKIEINWSENWLMGFNTEKSSTL